MPPTAELSPTIEPLQRDAVLREAQALRGESLARDAWRRLRRNRLAMACLVFLIVLSALALLTPLLPLQSPYMVDTPRAFAPPTARPLFIDTIKLDQVQPRMQSGGRVAGRLDQQAIRQHLTRSIAGWCKCA